MELGLEFTSMFTLDPCGSLTWRLLTNHSEKQNKNRVIEERSEIHGFEIKFSIKIRKTSH